MKVYFLFCIPDVPIFLWFFSEDTAGVWGVVERAQTLNPSTAVYYVRDSPWPRFPHACKGNIYMFLAEL